MLSFYFYLFLTFGTEGKVTYGKIFSFKETTSAVVCGKYFLLIEKDLYNFFDHVRKGTKIEFLFAKVQPEAEQKNDSNARS